jgi:DNA-binding response OmpR family regulator
MALRILIVDDDARLFELLESYLAQNGIVAESARDGARGLSLLAAGGYDAVLLDIMMPGMDGLSVLRKIRDDSDLPVIMLTAKGDETDRVVGLELGADDYLPKPFSPRELLARMRAVLRRGHGSDAPTTSLTVGPLVIDRDRHLVTLGGQPIELTAYQFDLLWVLAEGAGRVLPRERLHHRVREMRGEPRIEFDPAVDRSIDVHLSKIRGALAAVDDEAKNLIRTVRGVGYVLGEESV